MSVAQTQGHEVRWTARSWLICSAAVLAAFAAAAFCFLAVSFIPSSSRWGAGEGGQGAPATPWGYTILQGAPALVTAALAMLAAAFFLSSRHYGSQWLRGAAALVGIVALVGGTIACLSTTLWPELFYQSFQEQENGVPIQWAMVCQWSTAPLLTVGLSMLGVVAVARPKSKGKAGVFSAKTAFATGIALVAAALWAWFATSLYPLQSRGETITTGDYEYMTNPWPSAVAQAGEPLAMVGAGILLWGVLILATSVPAPDTESTDEQFELGEES
ncbi:hypothetical protein [Arthrobacter sp. TWP1-1]|uniref:hypothetical protein n=1 Tax=Arthrobacter sp. TWP1-1 TaxID=2804568 RepID=UPI003CF72250